MLESPKNWARILSWIKRCWTSIDLFARGLKDAEPDDETYQAQRIALARLAALALGFHYAVGGSRVVAIARLSRES